MHRQIFGRGERRGQHAAARLVQPTTSVPTGGVSSMIRRASAAAISFSDGGACAMARPNDFREWPDPVPSPVRGRG